MAENYGVKIAKEGFDVKTFLSELNKKNFNILSTEDCLLRKELSATKSETNMFLGYVITPDSDTQYYFGTILAISIASGGTGYTQWDLVDVVGGDSNAKVYVSAVSSGVVTDCFINLGGSGYEEAEDVATSGGTGSGFTIDITSITEGDARVRPVNFSNGVKTYVNYENAMPS